MGHAQQATRGTRRECSLDILGAHDVKPVSRAQATVFAVAFLGLWVGFTSRCCRRALMVPWRLHPSPRNTCDGQLLRRHLRRRGHSRSSGEVAAERDGVLLPILAEYIFMSFGGRVPAAIASLAVDRRTDG